MSINMNDVVVVTLTEFGAKVYNRRIIGDRLENYLTKVTEGHVLRTQLWYLFAIYGEFIGLGQALPFISGEIKLAEGK